MKLDSQTLTNVLLVLLVLVIAWLAIQVQMMHADIAPILNSRLAGAIAGL